MSSSESDGFFPGHFSFTDSFETQGAYVYCCSFKKSHKYLSAEVSFSSVPLLSSSEALVRSSDFDNFVMKIGLYWKFVPRPLSLLDILYKKTLGTITVVAVVIVVVVFLNAMTSRIKKKIIAFYFK